MFCDTTQKTELYYPKLSMSDRQEYGSLILSRYPGETIMLGDNITITVCSISKGRIKIRIYAHKSIPVYRLEIYNRLQNKK